MAQKVIDVSNNQGVISLEVWKKIKASGITRTMIRCSHTWGSKPKFTMDEDKAFKENIKNAHNAGMEIGVYHFSQALSEEEGRAEGKFAAKIVKKYKKWITLPAAYDFEFHKRLTASKAKALGKVKCMKICDAFCNEMKKVGFDTMVYSDLNTLNNYISAELSKHYKIWVAQYYKECQYKKPYYMWQYTNSGKVPGISIGVDLSYFYGEKSKISPEGKSEKTKYPGTFPTLPKRGYFKVGDKGINVGRVQSFLVWCTGVTLKIDNVYGGMTRAAVKIYQENYGLEVDGEFGKECLAMARKVTK